MALLAFKPAHNVPAELLAEHDADFAPIISFLQRSRYFFALTVQPLVYESHHQQFWASCSVSSSPNGRSLEATIDAHPIAITVETICRHLKFNDAGGRVSFTKDEVASTFKSMGYEGPLPSTTYLKGRVSYNYKYLIHVFLHCLSNKSGGWDQVPSDLASAIHGLVSNQLFNFSAFIFNNLVDNIMSPKKFCMYPRFLQHLFNEELGASLSLTGNTYKMPLVCSKIFVQLKKKSAQFSGTFTPLLSSMESPAPEGDSSVNPTDAEPTPSTSVPHPIKITYKCKRNPVQLSTVVQAPSTEPKQKKVKRTAQGTVLPKVKATPLVSPQVLPLKPVVALNQPESPQLMSQNISENIQRDAPIIEFASHEATSLDKRLSPKSPGSYHPEMPPTHTITQAQGTPALALEEPLSPTSQTLMRVVTQLQARFPDPEPIQSEVGPRSSEGVNAGEAATTVDLNKDPQDSGTGNRTSPAATYIGEDFFEVLLNEGNPGCQETTSGGGGAGARLRTPSPHDSTPVEEGTSTQELTATITSLQARVAQLEAEVATLRLEVQTKDATILDLRRRPPVTLHPFHPDPATTTFTSPDATKKGENIPTAGSGSEAREEEGAQEVTPSLVTLTAEWDDFLGTYFQDSSSISSSSASEDTREVAKETEQQTSNVSLEPQSPLGTKSPSETAAQVVMEDTAQEESISMKSVSPSGTEAAEALSSSPEPFVESNKESSKGIGQLEETVNAEVNSEAAAASEGPVILDVSSTEELHANEPAGEATEEISSGAKITADDKGKRKLTPEEEAEQEEMRPKKTKGRPNTSLDEERARLSALLEEKGYDFDEVINWSVPRMAAELDKVQQQEQAVAASKALSVLTKEQKEKAYRDKNKAFLLEYGFHARQLGPMKNSTMDMHIRDIKAKVARGELPSIEQIRARKESLMRGLGLGGGATIEFPLSGAGIREGEEVMCGAATKAMFPNMLPLNPKEEPISPPSSPSMDNMPISSVYKKGKKTTRKQSIPNPDPERHTQAEERRTEPSRDEDIGPQPTATTGAAVESTVEAQQARVLRSQATAQDKPRFTRRKSMAKRKKETKTIPLDSEPDTTLSVLEATSEATPKTTQTLEDMRDISRLMHEHSYIPLVNWSFNAQERIFILTDYNGEIKLVDLLHLMMLAKPYIFDLDMLPLNNPDNGADGRSAIRLIRKRAQVLRGTWKPSIGVSLNKHLRKEEVILRKQHCFRRITGSCRRLYKTTASEESSYALKTKTSEVYPLTKTVAAYSHSTKGTDTRHAGLSKVKDNM
ncbi:hypothetical protein E3N88_30453 [Mikania micrantha]|uniref:Uncharacterized protein n=1 Tax=Mikania micrantha TaxID=192012 RepID=A0A5N6MMK6_9ASTR|nr:hypothetical protein E3N88_30453 [Mikania micrantha]